MHTSARFKVSTGPLHQGDREGEHEAISPRAGRAGSERLSLSEVTQGLLVIGGADRYCRNLDEALLPACSQGTARRYTSLIGARGLGLVALVGAVAVVWP